MIKARDRDREREATAPTTTDADNAYRFASCATDGRIWICDVRDESSDARALEIAAAADADPPVFHPRPSPTAPQCLAGHEGEVNCVSFDPSGRLILSASDDHSAKIWDAATGDIVHDLLEHDKEVLTARWSGTGPYTDFPKYPLFVATGSADATCKLFDPTSGRLLHTLTQHTHPVQSLSFAPRSQLLATASHERVFVWNLATGSLLRTFKNLGDPLTQTANHVPIGMVGGLNDVAFDSKGEQLAAAYSDAMTYVMQLAEPNATTNNINK